MNNLLMAMKARSLSATSGRRRRRRLISQYVFSATETALNENEGKTEELDVVATTNSFSYSYYVVFSCSHSPTQQRFHTKTKTKPLTCHHITVTQRHHSFSLKHKFRFFFLTQVSTTTHRSNIPTIAFVLFSLSLSLLFNGAVRTKVTMKVLLPLLRTTYAFRSMQLSATADPSPFDEGYGMMTKTTTATTTTMTGLARQLPPLADGSRRVILVRHAETDWNTRGLMQGGGFDVELNDQGRLQAQNLADELRNSFPKVDVVASSHLARASETADIVASTFSSDDSPIRIINHKFGEMRFGDLEGLAVRGPDCLDETRRRIQDWNHIMHENKSIPWPGTAGESIQDVEQRANAGLAQILRGFPGCHRPGWSFPRVLLSLQ